MSEQSIFQAINNQLATLPGIDENNVAWLGVSYVPEAETPWIDVSMPVFTGKNLTLGSQIIYEWSGIYQVSCNWPMGGGIDDATRQMMQVRQLFLSGTTLTTSDGGTVKFFAPRPKPIFQDGGWVKGIVQCPWFLTEFQSL